MKIGILTLPLHHNYGGILQAWALQRVLKNFGHDVYILSNSNLNRTHWSIFAKRAILKCIKKGGNTPIFYELIMKRRNKPLTKFIKQNVNLQSISSLKNLNEIDFDAIIVGSDQIWRKRYFEGMWNSPITNAFLDFTKSWDIKRIAYAASFGVDEWQFNNAETKKIMNSLSYFNGISLREISGIKMLKEYTDIAAAFVLDPTMLISEEEYFQLLPQYLKSKTNIPGKKLVSYILDSDDQTENTVTAITKLKGLNRIDLNITDSKTPLTSIENWIYEISSADLVFTNSFHGCVFSIIFNKPLIFTGNLTRGNARFSSLMECFNIRSNYIQSLDEFDVNKSYELPRDITEKLSELRKQSKEFILSSLNL